jgi:hypothetical protein
MYGELVMHLPDDICQLYEEARKTARFAPTSSALCSRKLLMHIAVSVGAAPGLKFIEYVDFLANNGYLPPNGKGWVDIIRKTGNEATHEIRIVSTKEAEELIDFARMLLMFIYELPGRAAAKTQPVGQP